MLLDINDLLGKPYKKNERGPQYYDCYGLLIEVAKRLGHNVPDMFKIDESNPYDIEYTMLTEGVKKTDNPQFGDVVIFFDKKGRIFHCGVVLKNGEMVHCSRQGVNIQKISEYPKKGEYYTWLK